MERIPQARPKPAPTLNEKNRRGGKTLRVSLGCFVLPHPSVLTASQSSLSQKYNVKITFIASKDISTADSSLRDVCGSHSGNVHVQLQDAWMSRRLQYEDKSWFASGAFFMVEFSLYWMEFRFGHTQEENITSA